MSKSNIARFSWISPESGHLVITIYFIRYLSAKNCNNYIVLTSFLLPYENYVTIFPLVAWHSSRWNAFQYANEILANDKKNRKENIHNKIYSSIIFEIYMYSNMNVYSVKRKRFVEKKETFENVTFNCLVIVGIESRVRITQNYYQ